MTIKYAEHVNARRLIIGDIRYVKAKNTWIKEYYSGFGWIKEVSVGKKLKLAAERRRDLHVDLKYLKKA